TPSLSSATARPPSTFTQCSSMKPTFSAGSSKRDGTRTGRSPAISARSATRAARFADRTDAKVAAASTSVPPAVESAEIVTQSATTGYYERPVFARLGALAALAVSAVCGSSLALPSPPFGDAVRGSPHRGHRPHSASERREPARVVPRDAYARADALE